MRLAPSVSRRHGRSRAARTGCRRNCCRAGRSRRRSTSRHCSTTQTDPSPASRSGASGQHWGRLTRPMPSSSRQSSSIRNSCRPTSMQQTRCARKDVTRSRPTCCSRVCSACRPAPRCITRWAWRVYGCSSRNSRWVRSGAPWNSIPLPLATATSSRWRCIRRGSRMNRSAACRRPIKRWPYDRDMLMALTSFQLEAGKRQDAQATARRLVAAYPADPQVRVLAAQALGEQPP